MMMMIKAAAAVELQVNIRSSSHGELHMSGNSQDGGAVERGRNIHWVRRPVVVLQSGNHTRTWAAPEARGCRLIPLSAQQGISWENMSMTQTLGWKRQLHFGLNPKWTAGSHGGQGRLGHRLRREEEEGNSFFNLREIQSCSHTIYHFVWNEVKEKAGDEVKLQWMICDRS